MVKKFSRRSRLPARMLVLLLFVVLPLEYARANGGHDHGESYQTSTFLTQFDLSVEAIANLDLKTTRVELQSVQDILQFPAQLKLLPERQAIITPRFEGQVSRVRVRLGDEVEAQQPLIEVHPLAIGASAVSIASPIRGRVIEQNVIPGQIIPAGARALVIADSSQLLAKGLSYQSADLGRVKVGQEAEFVVDVLPDSKLSGTVQQIGSTFDSEDRTFAVYVLIDNPKEHLLPHFQGELSIKVGNPEILLGVPRRAILGRMGNYFVFVREDLSFERRVVELGTRKGDLQEVVSGLFPGEEVVVQGNYQLQFVTEEGGSSLKDDHHGHSH